MSPGRLPHKLRHCSNTVFAASRPHPRPVPPPSSVRTKLEMDRAKSTRLGLQLFGNVLRKLTSVYKEHLRLVGGVNTANEE